MKIFDRMYSVTLVAFACFFATTHASADGAAGSPAQTSRTAAALFSAIKIESTEQMAHKVVTGALGPWSRAEVWLTQASEVDDAPFKGRVVVTSDTKPAAVHELPPPDEPESLFLMKVRAVMFRNVDQGADKELIVLYAATRIGPQQPTSYSSVVYQWNGQSFARMPAVESKLSGAKNSAEIIRRLTTTKGKK